MVIATATGAIAADNEVHVPRAITIISKRRGRPIKSTHRIGEIIYINGWVKCAVINNRAQLFALRHTPVIKTTEVDVVGMVDKAYSSHQNKCLGG